ncbi:hypothetical protein [Pararhizobium sp. PWRC1-1]|uniref:hypothetical protein n=1 Tax=Pararhizobium sp. PWRC1-1 TaxID=2804566 RepID=UPI003CF16FBE
MEIDRIEWLREARQPHSYRRMYGLVVMIIASSSTTTSERRMANYIKGLLKNVMELAIASASILSKARIGFAHLTEIVLEAECSQTLGQGTRPLSPFGTDP